MLNIIAIGSVKDDLDHQLVQLDLANDEPGDVPHAVRARAV